MEKKIQLVLHCSWNLELIFNTSLVSFHFINFHFILFQHGKTYISRGCFPVSPCVKNTSYINYTKLNSKRYNEK